MPDLCAPSLITRRTCAFEEREGALAIDGSAPATQVSNASARRGCWCRRLRGAGPEGRGGRTRATRAHRERRDHEDEGKGTFRARAHGATLAMASPLLQAARHQPCSTEEGRLCCFESVIPSSRPSFGSDVLRVLCLMAASALLAVVNAPAVASADIGPPLRQQTRPTPPPVAIPDFPSTALLRDGGTELLPPAAASASAAAAVSLDGPLPRAPQPPAPAATTTTASSSRCSASPGASVGGGVSATLMVMLVSATAAWRAAFRRQRPSAGQGRALSL